MALDMTIKAVKGVKDILPSAIDKWRMVENCARDIFARFGFREIVLPVFEKSEVFIKGVGELTDIVQKEMYTFTDQGGESITLRPEGTASCVRAYIEHSMHHPPGSVTKLFYMGPMFRRERPQAGRFRQFYQIGAEFFGSKEPEADAELIHLLYLFMSSVKVRGAKILLNSLGCGGCRPAFKEALIGFLSSRKDGLCDQCRQRYEKNPLRVLDCKNERCGEIVKDAPTIGDHRCGDCQTHFSKVQDMLGSLNIAFTLNPRMARGLDYYTRTVFEIVAEGLGAKDAVAGGGRYDDLVKNSGGPDIPAIGFAIGMERLMESIGGDGGTPENAPDIYIVFMGDEAERTAFDLAGRFREKGLKVEKTYGKFGIKNQMGKANKSGAKLAVIIGEDEVSKKTVQVKDLVKGDQSEYPVDEAESAVTGLLK